MTIFWLIIGLIPATLCGWLALETLQGRSRMLTQAEQIVMGMVTGLTSWSFVMFLLHVYVGVPLSLWGFVLGYGVLIAPLGVIVLIRGWLGGPKARPQETVKIAPRGTISRPVMIMLIVLGLWTVLKIGAMAFMLVAVPPYFDDSVDNWNLRGKAYYTSQKIELRLAPDVTPSGISSYPPSVPTIKAWLASTRGFWDEPLVNGLHMAWYLACLVLTYCALRRKMGIVWSSAGTYVLASLPLFLFQGMNAYADVFLASHLLVTGLLLMYAASADEATDALAYLRMAAFALALIPFTKNEGLILYTPLLGLSMLLAYIWVWKREILTMRQIVTSALTAAVLLVLIGAPWTAFKWANGLGFGNAKSVSDVTFGWQQNVLFSIAVNTFYEGNWLLLFPFFLALFISQWRSALKPGLSVALLFLLTAYFLQFALYLFTGLSTEALQQTGYARGLIHLMPVIVIVGIFLLHDLIVRMTNDAVTSDQ